MAHGTANRRTEPQGAASTSTERGGGRGLLLAAAALLAAVFLFAACGGTEVDSPAPDAAPASAATRSTAVPAAETQSAALDALAAEQIVAAHEQVVNSAYQQVLPSVVHIHVTQQVEGQQGLDFLSQFGEGQGTPDLFRSGEGSGFVWDANGHIVTNHHVVAGADTVTATFSDGEAVGTRAVGQRSAL